MRTGYASSALIDTTLVSSGDSPATSRRQPPFPGFQGGAFPGVELVQVVHGRDALPGVADHQLGHSLVNASCGQPGAYGPAKVVRTPALALAAQLRRRIALTVVPARCEAARPQSLPADVILELVDNELLLGNHFLDQVADGDQAQQLAVLHNG